MGELNRMTQFKDKGRGNDSVKVGLFTYPVLMAADILAYNADLVPVGEDQKQHLELARNIAIRFNSRYGETFVVPDPLIPKVGARVMDLQTPTSKMSKSTSSPQGILYLSDTPEQIDKKVRRAVTDNDAEVFYDPHNKPGVSNLLELLGCATGENVDELATKYTSYGPLKADTAEALTELLRPVQARIKELSDNESYVLEVLERGRVRASELARATVDRASQAVGLLSAKTTQGKGEH